MRLHLLLANQVAQINLSAIIVKLFKFLGAGVLFQMARAFLSQDLTTFLQVLENGWISTHTTITSGALALLGYLLGNLGRKLGQMAGLWHPIDQELLFLQVDVEVFRRVLCKRVWLFERREQLRLGLTKLGLCHQLLVCRRFLGLLRLLSRRVLGDQNWAFERADASDAHRLRRTDCLRNHSRAHSQLLLELRDLSMLARYFTWRNYALDLKVLLRNLASIVFYQYIRRWNYGKAIQISQHLLLPCFLTLWCGYHRLCRLLH